MFSNKIDKQELYSYTKIMNNRIAYQIDPKTFKNHKKYLKKAYNYFVKNIYKPYIKSSSISHHELSGLVSIIDNLFMYKNTRGTSEFSYNDLYLNFSPDNKKYIRISSSTLSAAGYMTMYIPAIPIKIQLDFSHMNIELDATDYPRQLYKITVLSSKTETSLNIEYIARHDTDDKDSDNILTSSYTYTMTYRKSIISEEIHFSSSQFYNQVGQILLHLFKLLMVYICKSSIDDFNHIEPNKNPLDIYKITGDLKLL